MSLVTASHAKVYIDITSPALRKIPISIASTGSYEARRVGRVVKGDLNFTGIFSPVDPDVPGAEIRVNIEVKVSVDKLKAVVVVSDIVENKDVLRKRYGAPKKMIRALAHSISNDVFKIVTGREGIFRTKISYVVNSLGRKELYLMSWDGYNSRRIVSRGFTLSHAWSYDGRYIAYSSERKRRWGIYLLDFKNKNKKLLFSSKGLNLVGDISGNRVVFSSSKDGNPEIYTMDINKSNYRKVTSSFAIDISPVFSPDGSQIAFVSDRGGAPQIYIMNADGKNLRRITFKGNYNTSPAWSPDSKWIAFVGRKDGKNQIFMIKSNATELKQLTKSGNNEGPTFSPDGLFIAFDSDRDGNRGIYIMRVNGEGEKRVTPKNIKAMAPKWSPYIKK